MLVPEIPVLLRTADGALLVPKPYAPRPIERERWWGEPRWWWLDDLYGDNGYMIPLFHRWNPPHSGVSTHQRGWPTRPTMTMDTLPSDALVCPECVYLGREFPGMALLGVET